MLRWCLAGFSLSLLSVLRMALQWGSSISLNMKSQVSKRLSSRGQLMVFVPGQGVYRSSTVFSLPATLIVFAPRIPSQLARAPEQAQYGPAFWQGFFSEGVEVVCSEHSHYASVREHLGALTVVHSSMPAWALRSFATTIGMGGHCSST